jgi:CheY-like chemotaxis protein
MNTEKKVKILIAEDDDGHAELIKEALLDSGVNNPVTRFHDGQEVWEYLQELVKTDDNFNENAYLLLLDINMPRMDGVDVLRRVKKNEKLKSIPVIMLTTTDDPREVDQCYEIGCNIYITKPVDFLKFSDTLKRLGLFMQIVKL